MLLLNDFNTPVKAWGYDELINNNIQKVEAFSFEEAQKYGGKKDTILVYSQQIDLANHRLDISSFVRPTLRSYWQYGNFTQHKEFYDILGNVIKKITQPTDTILYQDKKSVTYKTEMQVDSFVYSNSGKLILSITKKYNNDYLVNSNKKEGDIHTSNRVKTSQWRYEYNGLQQETKSFHFIDSTRYLATNKDEKSLPKPFCEGCQKEYLYSDNFYDKNGNLKENNYYPDGKLHTKHFTYFSIEKLPIRTIDTIYNYCTDCKNSLVIIDNYYQDKLLVQTVTKERTGDDDTKSIVKYNGNGDFSESCFYIMPSFFPKHCEYHEYQYLDDKVIYEGYEDMSGSKRQNYYYYNKEGLLTEEKKLINDALLGWVFYKYTYFKN